MATPGKPETAKTEAPKAKAATKDAFAFAGMPAMDVPPAFRDMAENTVEQSKQAYEKFKTSAEEATTLLNDTAEKTRDGVTKFNEKALDVAKTNTDATLAHVKDVMAVKTFAEAIELQTAFAKTQFDAFEDQAKVFEKMTKELTEDTTAPYKAAFKKTTEAFKAA